MTGVGERDQRLVPIWRYLERLAAGYGLIALVIVPERIVQWAIRDADNRIPPWALALQLVALPVVAGVAAAIGGRIRDRKRDHIYAGLPDVTHEDPEQLEVVDEAAGLRSVVHRAMLFVFLIWFVLGLVLPFMASSIVAIALYAAIVARSEHRAARRDDRELLTRPRWFVWLPVAWRAAPAGFDPS